MKLPNDAANTEVSRLRLQKFNQITKLRPSTSIHHDGNNVDADDDVNGLAVIKNGCSMLCPVHESLVELQANIPLVLPNARIALPELFLPRITPIATLLDVFPSRVGSLPYRGLVFLDLAGQSENAMESPQEEAENKLTVGRVISAKTNTRKQGPKMGIRLKRGALYIVWLTLASMMLAGVVSSDAAGGSPDLNLSKRVEMLEAELASLRLAREEASVLGDPDTAIPAAYETQSSSYEGLSGESAFYEEWEPTIRVGGFFQADWAWFNQDANNLATVDDVQDGADFRRARLSASGDVWANVGFMIEFDFAFPGRPNFMDVYLDIRDTPVGTVRFGQWRQPIGMDGLTSVKELTFLERALPFAFLPFRQIGLGVFNHSADETATWAVSMFRFPTDAFGSNLGDDGGYGLASRVTFAPWLTEDGRRLLHLGAAYSFGDPANNLVRYRNQPEIFITEDGGADLAPIGVPSNVPPFVDTKAIKTKNFNLFTAESGIVLGSFYMQSEAIMAVVSQIDNPTVSFSGAYAHAGYFLTGEVRPYNRKSGVFGRVKPLNSFGNCGWGAWEIAARWSYINLNDKNINGRQLNDVTFGTNWYLNPRTKFQFNYIHAYLDDLTLGDSNADIFAVRGQIDF